MRPSRATVAAARAVLLCTVLALPFRAAAVCVGDCDRAAGVSQREVGVCIANLFVPPLSGARCGACDRTSDGRVTIDEVEAALTASLDSPEACPMVIPGPAPGLTVSEAVGRPGERVPIDISLQRHGAPLAAVSTDLTFDSRLVRAVLKGGVPDCALNPEIGPGTEADKQPLVDLLPSPPEARVLRAGVVSFANANVIPDGALFTCLFDIATEATGDFVLSAAAEGADPQSNPIDVMALDGRISVQALALATLTPTAVNAVATPTPSSNPTVSPTAETAASATRTRTRTRTPTRRRSATPTITPTAAPSATATVTSPPTTTPTRSPTVAATATASPTLRVTATRTASRTATAARATRTPSRTRTPSPRPTPSITPSPSRTRVPTITATPRPTSRTPSRTPSDTPSPTVTRPTSTATAARPTSTATVARPSSTATAPRPTPSPTATRTPRPPTRTPTATIDRVNRPRIDLGGATGIPDDVVEVGATLRAQGAAVASTSNDITFDGTQIDIVLQEGGKPDCTIDSSIGPESDIGKLLLTSLPPAPPTAKVLSLFIFALDSATTIPDGGLYTCNFRIAPTARAGIHLLLNKPLAATAQGKKVPVVGSNGRVTVQ